MVDASHGPNVILSHSVGMRLRQVIAVDVAVVVVRSRRRVRASSEREREHM